MVLAQPEQGVGDEEVADFVAPEVEHQRAPVGVRAPARVGVLIERGAVEAGQGELVAGEVRGHPIEDEPDSVLVHAVDERAEVVGRAVVGGGGVVTGDLVAPRAAERVGHDGQQFDVGEAHVGDVVTQLIGELGVAERAVVLQRVQPPGAEVDLVDRHRLAERLAARAGVEELRVARDSRCARPG